MDSRAFQTRETEKVDDDDDEEEEEAWIKFRSSDLRRHRSARIIYLEPGGTLVSLFEMFWKNVSACFSHTHTHTHTHTYNYLGGPKTGITLRIFYATRKKEEPRDDLKLTDPFTFH